MLGEDDRIEEVSSASRAELAIGFYVPGDKRLVIIGDRVAGGLNEESTIAHEYVHALQDSTYGIGRYRRSHSEDEHAEFGTTTGCVIEGDASVAQYEYLEAAYGSDWYSLLLAEYADNPALEDEDDSFEASASSIPDAMLRYFYFNYTECAAFVYDIWFEDGWDGVDALYEDPPASTEQILHPEKYRDGELPHRVEVTDLTRTLGTGWRPLYRTVFGEFDVYNYLLTGNLSISAAQGAAEGWGGGRMSVYTRGLDPDQDVTLHIALTWDTDADMVQFQTAFDAAIDRLGYEERSGDDGTWHWSSPGENGLAVWDDENARVDLLYGTDETAFLYAEAALLAD